MNLYYMGKFDVNEENLPKGRLAEHQNAVKFKEIDEVIFILREQGTIIKLV